MCPADEFAGNEAARDQRNPAANVTILDSAWAPGKTSASTVRVVWRDNSKTSVERQ